MKKLSVIAGGVLFVFGLAMTASAQFGMRQPTLPRGFFNPVVGAGAVYEVTSTADGQKNDMEFAIVGKESVDGKDGYWLEYDIKRAQSGEIIVKTLTVVDGATATVSRVIMQMPGVPPMEMPSQMSRSTMPADIAAQAEEVGTESVTTPAGTFSCKHYRMKDGSGDTWVSEKVAPFGVVKYVGKDSTMVVVKTISDAKDRITGTPQPFNPAVLMQQRGSQ
jgi:hypothetical protein